LKGNSRNDNIASGDSQKEKTSPPIVPFGFIDLEGLFEGRLVVVAVHLGTRIEVLTIVGRRLRISLTILLVGFLVVLLLVVLLLVILLLVVLLTVLVVCLLRRLHRIVLLAIAIRQVVVAVRFTASHGDSNFVEKSAK
jgi:hypothetical protein